MRTLTSTEHVATLQAALAGLGDTVEHVTRLGQELHERLAAGHRVLAVGNGGSAAQAQHLTGELVGRYAADRAAFSAICLSAETSTLTAIANDYPAEELYARQVAGHGRPGDVLVAFSTSGGSPNVVEAARRAHEHGLAVWTLTGPRPNPLADLADEALVVDAPSTATIQEVHLVLLHLLCETFDEAHFRELAMTQMVDG